MDTNRLLPESIYHNNSQVNGIFTSYDNSLLSLATNSGFKIYNMDTFVQVSDDDDNNTSIGPIKLAIPFYQSHLIFLIGKYSTSTLKDNQITIWNDLKKIKEATFSFKEPILNIKVCKEGLFVALNHTLLIFDIITLNLIYSILNINNSTNKTINLAINNDTFVLANLSTENHSAIKIVKIKCENYQVKAKLEVSISTPFKSIYKMCLNDKGTLVMVVGNANNRIHIYCVNSLKMLYCFRLENPFTQLINVAISKKNKFVSVFYSDNYLEIYELREGHKQRCRCIEGNDSNSVKNGIFGGIKQMITQKKQYFARYKFDYAYIDDLLSAHLYSCENTYGFIIKFVKMTELMIIDSHGITQKIKFNSKEKNNIWAYKEIKWRQDDIIIKE